MYDVGVIIDPGRGNVMIKERPLLLYKGPNSIPERELEDEFEIHVNEQSLNATPDLILLDLGVRITANELDLYRALSEKTGVPVLIRTKGTPSLAEKEAAINAGAVDILSLRVAAKELVLKIRGIINNNRRIRKTATRELSEKISSFLNCFPESDSEYLPYYNLSPREKEVAQILKAGLTNKEAAQKLNISEKTIATHIKRIYTKMGVTSRAGFLRKMIK
jgi:DNA-binding NarL/FixJ family response regulator